MGLLTPMMRYLRRLVLALAGRDMETIDLHEMHEKFDFIRHHKPGFLHTSIMGQRIVCLHEELDELCAAYEIDDMAGMADALIDLVYFAKGTAVMMGLPWEALWDDVHRANMSKVRGQTARGFAADLKKPRDWRGPLTNHILQRAGFDRIDYLMGSKDSAARRYPELENG